MGAEDFRASGARGVGGGGSCYPWHSSRSRAEDSHHFSRGPSSVDLQALRGPRLGWVGTVVDRNRLLCLWQRGEREREREGKREFPHGFLGRIFLLLLRSLMRAGHVIAVIMFELLCTHCHIWCDFSDLWAAWNYPFWWAWELGVHNRLGGMFLWHFKVCMRECFKQNKAKLHSLRDGGGKLHYFRPGHKVPSTRWGRYVVHLRSSRMTLCYQVTHNRINPS